MKTQRQKAAATPLTDLGACIAALKAGGQLTRVGSEVDPKFELAGIARALEGGKPVLFERVKGHPYPVLTGLLWNRAVVASLFGVTAQRLPFCIAEAVGKWRKNKGARPSPTLRSAPANEVVEGAPDLSSLPLPLHALGDGGRYLDSSLVVARHPLTGGINVSIHRMMMTRKDRLSFLIDPGRHLGEYVDIAESRGESLPVTINNGVGLAPWIVSSLPRLGEGKPAVANHLAGRAIAWMQAQTIDVPAYADAQFVIEAEILPGVREWEAPFAEVTGYYGGRDKRYVMKVKKITRRGKPVFHTVLSGQEVWNAVGFSAEAAIFGALRAKIPEVQAVFLPPGGCGFYQAVVQVANSRPGIGRDVIAETFQSFRSLQRVVVVDTDVNLYDAVDVDWAITTRFDPDSDLVILPGQEGHILNPIVKPDADGKGGRVTKMGMDALVPFAADRSRFARVKFKKVQLSNYDIKF